MTESESRMVCAGCGAEGADVYPFRCPRVVDGDNIDHVMVRIHGARLPTFPRERVAACASSDPLQLMMPVTGPNPFLVYRRLSYSYEVARRHGMSDADYVRVVEELDEAVAGVDGHGFVVTPFARHRGLSAQLGFSPEGGLWIKNETGNVSGSHKARHLMGVMIYLQVLDRLGLVSPPLPALAIASCGNAALAAAVVARAARRPLRVFIPPDAPASVVDRLIALHAERTVCHREPDVAGDPCYAAFRETVATGSLPFCCQGNENGLTIDGGETLGYEIISSRVVPDRVVIQVGGGALASSVIQAFVDGHALGALPQIPRFHAVQTYGAHPLERAYRGVQQRVAKSGDSEGELRYAATHRSEFMRPWETEPRSIAHGILDDETYDWMAVVKGMMATGGHPVLVDEPRLAEACDLARSMTTVDVDHTAAAGLAGVLELVEAGAIAPTENVVVIFTGANRSRSELS